MGRGGRSGGRGGSGGDLPRAVQVSKKLSWLLRHGAESEGLKLEAGGYVNLADVLANRKIKPLKVTFEEVKGIVTENDKQRFSLVHVSTLADNNGLAIPTDDAATTADAAVNSDDDDPGNWLIRANQGHSIKIAEEDLLQPLLLDTPNLPSIVVHGTTMKAWQTIHQSGGLKPMTRTHVHFATGLPKGFTTLKEDTSKEGMTQPPDKPLVISGMRNTSSVLIYIDLERALMSGLKFWQSANGVVLCSGNNNGIIPIAYFKRVESRANGESILLIDGMPTAGQLR